MNVFLPHHARHAANSDGVHRQDDEIRVDEQSGDEVMLLGCYSTEERARERIARARLLPGFVDEPDCFTVDRYEIDRDEWTEGYVIEPRQTSAIGAQRLYRIGRRPCAVVADERSERKSYARLGFHRSRSWAIVSP